MSKTSRIHWLLAIVLLVSSISLLALNAPAAQADGGIPGLIIVNDPVYINSVGITTTHQFTVETFGDITYPITVSFGLELPLTGSYSPTANDGDVPPWAMWSEDDHCESLSDFWTQCVIESPARTMAPQDGGFYVFNMTTLGNYPGNVSARIETSNSKGSEFTQFQMVYTKEYNLFLPFVVTDNN